MNGRDVIWDPLRRKEVALTPEERVRQWCIGILMQQCKVPSHMMMSEAGFKLGGKQFRADIVVYDRRMRPLAVVECKRPEVRLTDEVLDQAVRYNMVLGVRYILITNGKKTMIFERSVTAEGTAFAIVDTLPQYNEIAI